MGRPLQPQRLSNYRFDTVATARIEVVLVASATSLSIYVQLPFLPQLIVDRVGGAAALTTWSAAMLL